MPYRTPAPEQKQPGEPRWPAIVGIARAVRYIGAASINPATWRLAWWGVRVLVAFALMPFAMLLHGARELGGANPNRRDAPQFVAGAWNADEPGPLMAALMIGAGYLIGVSMLISSCATGHRMT